MIKHIVLVVGDKFAQFAAGKDIMTQSQLIQLLDDPHNVVPSHDSIVFLPGQGLSDAVVEKIFSLEKASPYRNRFDFSQWRCLPKRASALRSHKHCPQNTLISEPRRLNVDEFEMDILIDDESELMKDHQSGQHVQGMILVEAARQSLLVVTEAFYLPQDGTKYSFVFNDMSVKYNHFAFPIPAVLRHVICEKNVRKQNNMTFISEISIMQSGIETVSCKMSFSAVEAARISGHEGRQADKLFKTYISEVADQLEMEVAQDTNIAVNA